MIYMAILGGVVLEMLAHEAVVRMFRPFPIEATPQWAGG